MLNTSSSTYGYCNCDPVKGYDPYGYIYISNSQIRTFISYALFGMRITGGWAILAAILKMYIPVLLSWVNTLPAIGQVMFFAILICAGELSIKFVRAVYVYNCGVDISLKKGKLSITYK